MVASGPLITIATAEGDLTVAGSPPPVDPQARGVVVALSPDSVAGPGGTGVYFVRLTNVGGAAETFTLAATGLPASMARNLRSADKRGFSPTTSTSSPGCEMEPMLRWGTSMATASPM